MVDQKISQLPVASAISPTDISVLVSGGVDYQYAFSLLLTFLSSNLAVGATVSFGTSLPSNTFGNNGDVFINTTAQSFAQKLAGTWTVVYTISATGQLDGTVLFGTSTPPSNTLGNNGDTYINTTTGVFYKKATGAWTQVFSMASGPAGPRGNSLLNGSGAPTTQGVNGDFYYDTTGLVIYGPKAGGVWPGTGTSVAPQVPNTVRHGTTNPSNGLGIDGDFYINTSTVYLFGPKVSGAWPAGTPISGIPQPVRLNYPVGFGLPISINSFQTGYYYFGSNPRLTCEQITGGAWLTASILVNTTSASNGTYTARAIVDNTGIYNTTGIGSGGTATFVVSGGLVTSVTKVSGGNCYYVGDTFTCVDVPGAVFKIATNAQMFYQDVTSSMTKIKGEITDGLPDSFSIDVLNDGGNLLSGNLQITISV